MFNSWILLLSRFSGFFLISPLFADRGIPKSIRFGLALGCSLILAPPLATRHPVAFEGQPLLPLLIAQEAIIGYLLGFLFSLLFEAAAFAGQWVGTAMGFSATELLDPSATSQHPLMGRFFALIAFALFLALDLHHPLLRFLYGSFDVLPPLRYPFTPTAAVAAIQGSSLLFQQALAYAAFPLTLLLSLTALFTLLSRFFPIFWIGFPLQLLIGLSAIAGGTLLLTPLLEHAFTQLLHLLK